jgi:hypothetical protein
MQLAALSSCIVQGIDQLLEYHRIAWRLTLACHATAKAQLLRQFFPDNACA